jgi:hypothetical protein
VGKVVGDGTFTVLAVEVKQSTRSGTRTLDQQWAPVRDLAADQGAVQIGDTPGGTAVAFRSAAQAVRSAVTIQQVTGASLELAIGLHAGEI